MVWHFFKLMFSKASSKEILNRKEAALKFLNKANQGVILSYIILTGSLPTTSILVVSDFRKLPTTSILVVATMSKTAKYEYTRSSRAHFEIHLNFDWFKLFGIFFLILFCKVSYFKNITFLVSVFYPIECKWWITKKN